MVIFSLQELDYVVSECDGNKSLGPYEFNFSFLKIFWNLVRDDLGIIFNQFRRLASLALNFASYFVTLIPKIESLSHLGEFRLISLVGFLYKLVVKVYTIRLKLVMDNLISANQMTFLKGRMLMDEMVTINKVIDLAKRSNNSCIVFKVDFEKAYNSVRLAGAF